MQGKFLAK
jgi:hypothetical protein